MWQAEQHILIMSYKAAMQLSITVNTSIFALYEIQCSDKKLVYMLFQMEL